MAPYAPREFWTSRKAPALLNSHCVNGLDSFHKAAISIFMTGFINSMLLGLMAGGSWYSRDLTFDGDANHARSLRQGCRGHRDRQDLQCMTL
jgi:hypothetical protein